jgi:hypothetical protein
MVPDCFKQNKKHNLDPQAAGCRLQCWILGRQERLGPHTTHPFLSDGWASYGFYFEVDGSIRFEFRRPGGLFLQITNNWYPSNN